MAEELDLIAEFREDSGKGSSRRLRHAGKVPAIIYGGGRDPRALTFDHNALIRAMENEAFFSSVLKVQVGENVRRAILKDVQVHPSKRQIMHLDLQRIKDDEKIRMTVPVHIANEETAVGVKLKGGVLSRLINEVEVVCLPGNLPEFLELDVAELDLDGMLHLSDLPLPDGVELPGLEEAGDDSDHAVVSIHLPKVAAEPEEEEEAAEEGGEEASGENAEEGDKEE